MARGYTWNRDERPRSLSDHQADGVAVKGDIIELIEVELTAKKLARYQQIHTHHGTRLTRGAASRVVYVCTADVARVVAREADKFLFRDQRSQLVTLPLLDEQGKWVDRADAIWSTS